MKYRLKKGSSPYEVVDGPLAGRRFTHNCDYSEFPAADAARFEEVVAETGDCPRTRGLSPITAGAASPETAPAPDSDPAGTPPPAKTKR